MPDSGQNNKQQGIIDTFQDWESSLKRFIGRFLHRPEDIEDMVQETFLRAYRATRERRLDSPKAYLFKVARNVAFRELAKKSRHIRDTLDESRIDDFQTGSTLEEEIAAQQKIRLYLDAIAELPPQCRRVFLMRKYQGLSHKEIARNLGISTSAVEKHIAFGAQRCRKYIAAVNTAEQRADSGRHQINRRETP